VSTDAPPEYADLAGKVCVSGGSVDVDFSDDSLYASYTQINSLCLAFKPAAIGGAMKVGATLPISDSSFPVVVSNFSSAECVRLLLRRGFAC
jgi:hypothetical protein